MAIAFRSAATAANGAAPTSLTVNRPTGVVDDDLLVAFVANSADQTIAAAPAGWTQLDSRATGTATGDCRHTIYWKLADSEPSSYLWNFSAGTDCAAVIVAYSGVSPAAPINVSGYRLMASSTVTHTAPSVTPATTDTVTITAYAANPFFDGDTTFTTPTGLTARAEADPGAGTTNRAVLHIFDEATTAAEPTGDQTTTLNNSAKGVAFTITVAVDDATDLAVTIQPYRQVASATGCMIGWYDQKGYSGTNGLQAMETLLDTRFAAVRIYHTPGQWGSVDNQVATVLADGRLPVCSHKPPKVANVWVAIARGDYDDDITDLIDTYKTFAPQEIVVIFHHEPHGHASDVGSKTPTYGRIADFVRAFRRFAKMFRDAGADHVKIGYCAIDSKADDYPNDPGYPGHDYVDVWCHDVYNWGGYPGFSDWKDPDELFAPFVADAKAANKPLLFGEIGSHPSNSHDRAAWIAALGDYLRTDNDASIYVVGFCYYHVDNHDNSGHYWRFAQGSTADATDEFITAISHHSHFLTQPISPSLRDAEPDPGGLGEGAPSGGTPPSVVGLTWARKTTVGGVNIGEVSGVCASPKGGVWAIRDSGNPASLYWLTQTSRGLFTSHEVPVTSATNADWEDCFYTIENGQGYVWVHDNRDGNSTGTNPRRLYKITEPATPSSATAATIAATYYWKFPADAPVPCRQSGATSIQNCEAMAMFKGVIYAVHKTKSSEANVYSLGAPGSISTNSNSPTTATLVGTIAHKCPSSFAISADGTTVVTVSHGETKVWRGKGDTIESLLTGKNILVWSDQPAGSGEGAGWWPYGSSDFLVISEDKQTFDYDVGSGRVATSGIPTNIGFGTATVTLDSGPLTITEVGGIPSPADYQDPEETAGLDFGTLTATISGSPTDTPDLEGFYEFSPPVTYDMPLILPETRGPQRRLFRHYGNNPRGQSVLRTAGVYRTVTAPSQLDIDQATEYYAGGHIYTITADTAEDLIAAGYADNISPAPEPPGRTLSWGYLAGGSWGDFFETYGTWG